MTAATGTLRLTNTLTRKKELFSPRDDAQGGTVKMFTCGPSIYQRPHIGNYRTFMFEDILHRYLLYLEYSVKRVLNFTDVEDKAIAQAHRENITLKELTDPVAKRFFEEIALLNITPPTYNPRSSTSVDASVELIRKLLENGHAYRHNGDIFYDPLTFDGFGKLFRMDMSKWPKKKVRFQEDTYEGRRWNRGDFILWHGYRADRDGVVFWETELGKGRPAWNIQDAAMCWKTIGPRIDIYCGGIDNLYRHHDYTIAIIEGVTGDEFSRFWLHGEHLLINGKKMSKSKGNIIYVDDLINRGYTPPQIRFFLIYGHYRERLNFNDRAMSRALEKFKSLRGLVQALPHPSTSEAGHLQEIDPDFTTAGTNAAEAGQAIKLLCADFEACMNDDLNVRSAIDKLVLHLNGLLRLHRDMKLPGSAISYLQTFLKKADGVLGVLYS